MYFSIDVYRKDTETFVASCPELDIFSYGPTLEVAVNRLKKIVHFYMESADEMGMSLEELGLAPPEEKDAVQRVSHVNIHAAIN